MVTVYAYSGRDNEIRRELLEDGSPLDSDKLSAITDIVLHINGACLKMTSGDITMEDGVLTVKLGKHVPEVDRGYIALLSIVSLDKPDGEAWERWNVMGRKWPVCAPEGD